MQNYFDLKKYMQKTFNFFENKYGSNYGATIGRTYVESVVGFEGVEYRLRLLFLNYAITVKQVDTPIDLFEESIMNLDELRLMINSFEFNENEKNDLLYVMNCVSSFLKKDS